MTNLVISQLSVSVEPENVTVIDNLNLSIQPGSVHAIMGKNGSGKSSLAYTIMGHPKYRPTQGTIVFNQVDITSMAVHMRAHLGIFLSLQHPIDLPGVIVINFLKAAYEAIKGVHVSINDFKEILCAALKELDIDESFAYRSVNEGFSGGEKKRLEMLQLLILKPKLAILDEIDSGLDTVALQHVCNSLLRIKSENPDMSMIIITHYQRMLEYMQPNYVHTMHAGKIA